MAAESDNGGGLLLLVVLFALLVQCDRIEKLEKQSQGQPAEEVGRE